MTIHSSTAVLIYSLVIAFVLGAVFGSFLNCVAVRIVNKESVVNGRSHCMNCGHALGVLDLVPLFSLDDHWKKILYLFVFSIHYVLNQVAYYPCC